MNIPEALLTGLLAFAADQLGAEPPKAVPEIVVGETPWTDTFKALAIYDNDTITLREACDPAQLLCQAILVHELVHYVQDVAGLEYACYMAREQPAYVAMVAYVKEFGVVEPYAYLGFGIEGLEYLYGNCGGMY